MITSDEQIVEYLQNIGIENNSITHVQRLSGGTANYVWRVDLKEENPTWGVKTFVAKHAEPFIASNISIPFEAERMNFEMAALKVGSSSDVALPNITAPKVFQYDADKKVALMEYVANASDLKSFVSSISSPMSVLLADQIGKNVGHYIARLHTIGVDKRDLLEPQFTNPTAVRMSKYALYDQIESVLDKYQMQDEQVPTAAKWAGEFLLNNPITLCMGDYWPGNILISADLSKNTCNLHVVDWELCRYAPPSLDLAQFLAEVYTLSKYRSPCENIISSCLATYSEHHKITPTFAKSLVIHFGCHLMVWTPIVGWFDSSDVTKAQEIVKIGAEYVRHGWQEDSNWLKSSALASLADLIQFD